MTKDAINQYLDELEEKLLNESGEIAIELNILWIDQFPNEAAVYILREGDRIAYVAETDSLKNSMAKILDSKSENGNISSVFNDVVEKHLKLSYISISLGRKELEERVLKKIGTEKKAYTKAEKQQEHKNAYERWTEKDDERLELLFCEGKSVKELMSIFERNEGSIRSRIEKLELRNRE